MSRDEEKESIEILTEENYFLEFPEQFEFFPSEKVYPQS
jgi:hypothetical protein